MDRARRAGTTALVTALALISVGLPAGPRQAVAAAVGWPVSTLLVSEVQTGGASASDEFVEIANQGSGLVDLVGLELVYATSSGSTVTRKASWSGSFILEAGRRVLVVNAAGAYAPAGDLVYSGGFAATGGAVALRVIGGSVVDAVGGGTPRTRSWKAGRRWRHPPVRVWSGRLAMRSGTASTRMTTHSIGS